MLNQTSSDSGKFMFFKEEEAFWKGSVKKKQKKKTEIEL